MENNKEQLKQLQVAEIQLVYKSRIAASQRLTVSISRDAYEIFLQSWDEMKIELVEQFKVMLINRNGKVLGIVEISSGGIGGTVADPKLIFVAALKAGASAIIVSHNHPSGNLQPSQADIALTKKLKEAGKFLEIRMNDHIIITAEGYYSFADEGLI